MRRLFVFALGAVTLLMTAVPLKAQTSDAQNWPQRSVKFIIPLGPGAGVDIGARLFADRLAARWGKPVVIENRPGGDGVVAITAFTAARDDHTLLVTPTSSFTAHPYLHDKLPYQASDLEPIARISNTIVAVAVPQTLKVNTMPELFAMARAEPGKLNWATITGLFDFIFAGYLKKADLNIARVPYRNPVEAANDLAEGRIQLMLSAIAIVRPQVLAGRVKMIAVTSSERASVAPELPTTSEAGFPDLKIDGLIGLFGPPDMPMELRERIAADIRAVAADPAIAERLAGTGQVLNPGGPAEFGAAIRQQRAQAASVGALMGIKPAQ